MQRRTLLKLGIFTGTALVVIGGGARLLRQDAWRSGRLTGLGDAMLRSVARAVLEGSLPDEPGAQLAALTAHVDRLEGTLRAMPLATQREFGRLVSLMALPPGRWILAGLGTDWPSAGVAQVQSALQSMRTSRLALRRQAYQALRDLTHAAYFADSTTWVLLGYPGPMKIE